MADPDRRSTLLNSYENAAVIVSGIAAEELGRPTPCRNYDVAGLVDHLVEAGHRAAALGRGQAPPPGDDSPHLELSDAPDQLRRAAEEAAQAWGDHSRLSSGLTMPWGEEFTGATLVDMYLAELAAHAWDLAVSTHSSTGSTPPSPCRRSREHGSRSSPSTATGGTRVPLRSGGARTSRRRRLGTPRRLHGTQPTGIAR